MQLGDAVFVADIRYVKPRHGYITEYTIDKDSTGWEQILYTVEFNDYNSKDGILYNMATKGVFTGDLIFYDGGSAISKLNTLRIVGGNNDK